MVRRFVITLAALLMALPSLAQAQSARTELKDAQGKSVGTATLSEAPGGVHVVLQAKGLPPGQHGFHIHAVGKCDPPDFTSAGPHLNPYGKKHGHKNPEGFHAGDLPNLAIGADATGSVDATAPGVTLKDGPGSVFHPGGTTLIVHADPDDEKTDPAGNSGARVACGVIQR